MEALWIAVSALFRHVDKDSVSVFAACASVVSAISAWRNARAARANLRMAKIEFQERHDSMTGTLIDGVCWDSPEGERIVSFACSYTNTANSASTVTKFELLVHAKSKDGTQITAVFDPSSNIKPRLEVMQKLTFPLNLQARTTASGWILFELPKYIIQTKIIDNYEIKATTSNQKSVSIDCYILKELESEDRED